MDRTTTAEFPVARGPSPLRTRRGWWLFGLLVLAAGVGLSAEPVSKEYQLKAAFIYNFVRFVEWPNESFADTKSPIVVGVFGQNPFGAELENAVRGRRVNGRAIVVKSIQSVQAAKATHLLFVGAADDAQLAALEEACRATSVLIVGESPGFARRGGAITFTLEGDKLRFEINAAAAAAAGLKISAQLQKLAKAVPRDS